MAKTFSWPGILPGDVAGRKTGAGVGEKRGGLSGFTFQRGADGSRLEKSELQEDIS